MQELGSGFGLFTSNNKSYEVTERKIEYDYLAPDGSEIRLLPRMQGGSLCHCILPIGKTSTAVKHKTVEELWYVVKGNGQIWLLDNKKDTIGKIYDLKPGTSIAIPPQTSFQFRNLGKIDPLEIMITTMPAWPGKEEAILVNGEPSWCSTIQNSKDINSRP